jgi:RNA polymerase sigma-54 factor
MQTLSQTHQLLQKLTPQQVQYLKLLQLPVLSLEQRIKEELELNPLLEEGEETEITQEQEPEKEAAKTESTDAGEQPAAKKDEAPAEDAYTFEDFMNDDLSGYKTNVPMQDEEREEMPLADDVSLSQRLLDQIHLLNLTEEEQILAEEIIGNIDEDGYLRRELPLIVQDLNLGRNLSLTQDLADSVLSRIQRLEPPGIGARTLQECLIVQLEVADFPEDRKSLALRILRDLWEEFSMKHFETLSRELSIDTEQLRSVIELIQKLNPKPGEGEFTPQQNYVVPDFTVERDDGDFVIMLNDRNIPPLRVNKKYKELMSRKKSNGATTEVKDFIRKQFESAKWFITSIHQRRETMMKVMRAIVDLQRDFFETGENLHPMIYKDIAEIISMDISTISRVVNGKYTQTEYGVFELRHFFSDSLSTSSGEEISNKEVKKTIKDLIESEDPNKPMSDDRIAELLRAEGLNIARRTVAKYREAMNIPVARLRRKI